jgi:inhibitor of KinA sporulation pathway (predicted exonuclease)
MLTALMIEHEGHHHSGIDDVVNIIKIVREMMKDGCRFQRTSMYVKGEMRYGDPYLDKIDLEPAKTSK